MNFQVSHLSAIPLPSPAPLVSLSCCTSLALKALQSAVAVASAVSASLSSGDSSACRTKGCNLALGTGLRVEPHQSRDPKPHQTAQRTAKGRTRARDMAVFGWDGNWISVSFWPPSFFGDCLANQVWQTMGLELAHDLCFALPCTHMAHVESCCLLFFVFP